MPGPRTKAPIVDPFLPLDELSQHTGLSVSMLQKFIRDPVHPLPFYRFGAKVEVRRSEFDAWAYEHHRVTPEVCDVVALVDAQLAGRRRR